jgi:phosphoglucosamine mutase
MSGADVISYNTDFESGLINNNCGSTHPEVLKNIVLQSRADIGFSYDGDGDRVIGCDSKGRIFDGDVIMAFCAINMKNENILKNNSVVTTIMANYGFEKAMQENNIKVYKTNVGDRYVLEKMIETDSVLGGEQSGHIIFKHFSHIGDGLVSTLIFLEYLNKTEIKINEIYDIIEHYPQLLKNLKVKNKNEIMQSSKLKQKISEAQNKLEGKGKVVVRSSGTEPLIRIMVEAKTLELATEIQEEICNFIYRLK